MEFHGYSIGITWNNLVHLGLLTVSHCPSVDPWSPGTHISEHLLDLLRWDFGLGTTELLPAEATHPLTHTTRAPKYLLNPLDMWGIVGVHAIRIAVRRVRR